MQKNTNEMVITEKIPFQIIDEIIVRTPIYPYKHNITAEHISILLDNDFFLEAIYIASPLLYDEVIKLKNNSVKKEKDKERILNSLYKYYSRMCTRSTPFGLFSTCGVAKWSDEKLSNYEGGFYRNTRLDMFFLQRMITVISQITYINRELLYYPNNSIYPIGEELRYIEYSYVNGLRYYKISAVNKNEYILKVIKNSEQGVTKSDLVNSLKETINNDDAINFIENLVDSQLLISEFDVAPTSNDDFTAQIQKHLENMYNRTNSWYIGSFLTFFKGVIEDIHQLDTNENNRIEEYKKIILKLKQLQPIVDDNKTFHIDSYSNTNSNILARDSIKGELYDLLQYLTKNNANNFIVNEKIEYFKNKFVERYETQSVLLSEVLDEDFGIGYPADKKSVSAPMVDDIPFRHQEINPTLKLSMSEIWLFEILKKANKEQRFIINLNDEPQRNISENEIDWSRMPYSMSAMFKVLDDEAESLYFEGFFGPSAASVISRFAHGNKDIKSIATKIVEKEEENSENCIFAEFVHVPDNRITNVILRPTMRKYEIPYLATGSSTSNTIEFNDLYIKIQDNQIILFSKKLNKRIIPCKTNMHNHFSKSLPVYHFLGDLQNEGTNRDINFSWGNLSGLFVFFPRVNYKNIVIAPAHWILPISDIEDLKKSKNEDLHEIVKTIREKYNIVNNVLYVEGDNELPIDFSNPFSVEVWVNLLRNKSSVILKEFITNGKDDRYIHQYVATLINKEKKYFHSPLTKNEDSQQLTVKKSFPLGSEWLYLKFYCGIGSSDIVLTNIIYPKLKEISQLGLIEKWFYIKYYDPDHHIRLRLNLKDKSALETVLSILNQGLEEKTLIWKIQPDVYTREIERYGANTMECCESLFFIDSLVAVELIALLQHTKKESMVFWWGMRLVDDFLTAFNLSTLEKLEFVNLIRNNYQREFNANRESKEKINVKYNNNKSIINEIMCANEASMKYGNIVNLFSQKISLQSTHIDIINKFRADGSLMINIESLVSSLIHMMLNRLITKKERIHEFLIYEFLYKYYKMIINKGEK